jgi:diguanylate cyclase (GGDEF)-like protein
MNPSLLTIQTMTWNVPLVGALCLLAYTLGVWQRQRVTDACQGLYAVYKARNAANCLEKIARSMRRHIRGHQSEIARFQRQLNTTSSIGVHEVEKFISTSRHLSTQLRLADEEICAELDHLLCLTESRVESLTGIANRRAFDEEIRKLLKRHHSTGQPFAYALLDIDHFKQVNDGHGHEAGDQVLQHVVDVMVANARDVDFLARVGGEEFAMLLQSNNIRGAVRGLERIRNAIAESPMQLESGEVTVTISVGVVEPNENETRKSLQQRADAALYHAKRNGRNRICVGGIDGQITSPAGLEADNEAVGERRDSKDRDQRAVTDCHELHPSEAEPARE